MNRFGRLFVFAMGVMLLDPLNCGAGEKELNDHWHNFRGPNYNGVSETAHPPTTWSSTENVAWKVELPGKGSSSPIVWGDRVFISSAIKVGQADTPAPKRMNRREIARKFDEDGDGQLNPQERKAAMSFMLEQQRAALTEHQFVVICFDRSSGKELWKQVAVERKPVDGHHRDSGYASASPVTDGEVVIVNFGSMGLYCYDMKGALKWKRTDLGEMTMRGSFGEGSSVVISGDSVVLPWDHEGPSRIEVLNRMTGDTVWKTERDEPSNWVTPRVVKVDGQMQIIQGGQNYTRGYDLESG
ncbi:MAG: PQQ-binding-like beta-propeller repeat protein, partial [Planctomycetota bacterium]